MDQVTISKEEDVAEPTYQQGSNPTEPLVQDQGPKFVSNLVHKLYSIDSFKISAANATPNIEDVEKIIIVLTVPIILNPYKKKNIEAANPPTPSTKILGI